MMGLLPSYQTLGVSAPLILLLLRIMQGAAIGGKLQEDGYLFLNTHHEDV